MTGDTAHGLHRLHHWRHRPVRQQILDLPCQAFNPSLGVCDRMDVILQHHLLGGVIKAHRGQPAPIGQGPAPLAGINTPVPQQEALQMLTRLAEHPNGCGPRPDQVAHRLVCAVRDPNSREVSGAVQLRQHHRIPAIGFHPVADLHRDQRRRHHDAVVPQVGQLPMQTVATGTGLVAEAQPPATLGQLFRQLGDLLRRVADASQLPHLTAPQPSATVTATVALWTSSPT
nr:hypothetical protein [Azospirillum argentinense]